MIDMKGESITGHGGGNWQPHFGANQLWFGFPTSGGVPGGGNAPTTQEAQFIGMHSVLLLVH